MDAARYYLALFIVAFAPGVFIYWFSIHPFIHFWRRVGARLTITIHLGVVLLLAYVVYLNRGWLLAVDYGSNTILVALSVPLLVCAGYIRLLQNKELKIRALVGFPELAPEQFDNSLVSKGIYSRIRHPRYVEIVLSFLFCALFTNYLAAYVVFVCSVLWVALLVPLEEKELRERFGEAYVRYAERVPRFFPKLYKRLN